MTMKQAMDAVYGSHTYEKLSEPAQVYTTNELSMSWTCCEKK